MSEPGVPGPSGLIRLTIAGWGPFVPTVHVNDRLIRVHFGTQDVPVPAGPTVVRAYVTAAGDYGHAQVELNVAPGGVETVHYTPPWNHGLPGVIGRQPPSGWRRLAPSPAAALVLVIVAGFVLYGLLR